MTQEIIKSELQLIFRSTLNIPDLEITEELSADHIPAWDSLSHLILITEVEGFFNVKFRLKELISMKNVGDMIVLIEEKKNI
jgi:acyl carrier protein